MDPPLDSLTSAQKSKLAELLVKASQSTGMSSDSQQCLEEAWQIVSEPLPTSSGAMGSGAMTDGSKRRATAMDESVVQGPVAPAAVVRTHRDTIPAHLRIYVGKSDEELTEMRWDLLPKGITSFRVWSRTLGAFGKMKESKWSYAECMVSDPGYRAWTLAHMKGSKGAAQRDWFAFCQACERIDGGYGGPGVDGLPAMPFEGSTVIRRFAAD